MDQHSGITPDGSQGTIGDRAWGGSVPGKNLYLSTPDKSELCNLIYTDLWVKMCIGIETRISHVIIEIMCKNYNFIQLK